MRVIHGKADSTRRRGAIQSAKSVAQPATTVLRLARPASKFFPIMVSQLTKTRKSLKKNGALPFTVQVTMVWEPSGFNANSWVLVQFNGLTKSNRQRTKSFGRLSMI